MGLNDTEYEKLVQSVYQTIVGLFGGFNVSVQHNIKIEGKSRHLHQIDVYWEFRQAGVTHRVAIECKNYSNSITVGKVRDFFGVISDIPGLKGVMVTKIGYQLGAVKFATHNNIGLRILRETKFDDFENRSEFSVPHWVWYMPKITSINVIIDKIWISENLTESEKKYLDDPQIIKNNLEKVYVFGSNGEDVRKITEIVDSIMIPVFLQSESNKERAFELDCSNLFISFEFVKRVKLKSFSINYILEKNYLKLLISPGSYRHILTDIVNGGVIFIDEDGKIIGDVDQL